MGITVFGTTGRAAEFRVCKFGVEICGEDGQRNYPADPVEVGEVALLALTGQGPDGSKAWAAADGERFLRAYWFLRPPGPGALRDLVSKVSSGLGSQELIKELEKLAGGFSKRPVFGFCEEELRFDVLGASQEASEGADAAEAGETAGEETRGAQVIGKKSHPVWLFGRFELSELVREAALAARERLREEKLRLVGGLGVVSTEDGSGLGLLAGNAGVLRLSEDMLRKLRAFLLKVLYQEYGGHFREGALTVYVPNREFRKVRRSGDSFWKAGVVIKVADYGVRLTSPVEVVRLLVFLVGGLGND